MSEPLEPLTPMPDLPPAKAPAEDERSVLLGYLDYHRTVLARKVGGLSDAQSRIAACPPSEMTLLGMIRHMADVERFWFRRRLVGEDLPALFDEDAEWVLDDGGTLTDALEMWHAEIAASDANIAATEVDAFEQVAVEGQSVSTLRRVLVHLIEEYARHCGQADLLRQAIDGAVGD